MGGQTGGREDGGGEEEGGEDGCEVHFGRLFGCFLVWCGEKVCDRHKS
jgi:hypothetical protein